MLFVSTNFPEMLRCFSTILILFSRSHFPNPLQYNICRSYILKLMFLFIKISPLWKILLRQIISFNVKQTLFTLRRRKRIYKLYNTKFT